MYRLRDLREDWDLKQADIARLLNCEQQTYSRYELGQHEIPIASLIILAKYYQVSVDYILRLTDIKIAYPKDISLIDKYILSLKE